MLPSLVETLVSRVQTPLCIDSSNPEAIIRALPFHAGSALVNSISGEENKMELLTPACKIWGSPFILLPLTGANLPKTAKERISIIEQLLLKAEKYAIPRHLIMIDILALTAASDGKAPAACLETVKWCHKEHLHQYLCKMDFPKPKSKPGNKSGESRSENHGRGCHHRR